MAESGGRFVSDFDTAITDQTTPAPRDDTTPGHITAAVCAVHRHALDDADELELLQALGLAPRSQSTRRLRAQRRQAQERDARERGKTDPTLIPHGTASGYEYWGCRCVPCIAGNTRRGVERNRHRRQARKDKTS